MLSLNSNISNSYINNNKSNIISYKWNSYSINSKNNLNNTNKNKLVDDSEYSPSKKIRISTKEVKKPKNKTNKIKLSYLIENIFFKGPYNQLIFSYFTLFENLSITKINEKKKNKKYF